MVNLKQPETVEECLQLQSHFIGIAKITEKNHKEFYKRGKILQALGLGFLDEGRMPTLEEVHDNINLTTDAQILTPKKWKTVLLSILDDMATKISQDEQEAKNNAGVILDSTSSIT
tara:strand:- start:2 stop:349 length:348 start_codon:yes stop_codon:yes gene_type:complete